VMIPSMVKAGYGAPFAAAVTAAANVVGPIIPPSIAFILIGVLANLSITRLFLAGIVPGILYSLAMLAVAYTISRRRNYPVHGKASGREILAAAKHAAWALAMPVLIVAGIRSGVFNVTECSAVAVLYALFVGTVVHRELTLAKIGAALVATGRATAIIMIVIGGAQIVAWLLAYENVPQELAQAMLALSREPWVFLLLVNVLLIMVGTFMENGPAMVMLVPVLYPIATALGIDPIHFSMVMSINLIIGLITPPVALCVSIAAIIGRVPMSAASREVWPFLLAAIAVQLLITFVPALSLAIPNLIMGNN
jgi:tripartite ATP-independent transporter DctM subunit